MAELRGLLMARGAAIHDLIADMETPAAGLGDGGGGFTKGQR